MLKVNGHRYNIVCDSNFRVKKPVITEDTLFAIYCARDDRRYSSGNNNRAFVLPCKMSQIISILEYLPAECNLRLTLRPRKTNERRTSWYRRQAKLKKLIQAKLKKVKED